MNESSEGVSQPPERAGAAGEGVMTEEEAFRMGATGAQASDAERLLFEAWMRGHSWSLSAEWVNGGYLGQNEKDGRLCPRATRTRQLWAAWRDRAALSMPTESR